MAEGGAGLRLRDCVPQCDILDPVSFQPVGYLNYIEMADINPGSGIKTFNLTFEVIVLKIAYYYGTNFFLNHTPKHH